MRHWLLKSEPSSYSIDDLARDGVTGWDGVRNYQARNHMDAMKVGDRVLIYHSNAEPSGVAGLAVVQEPSHPDPTAWDPRDHHYDPRSTPEQPVWRRVAVRYEAHLPAYVSLDVLRDDPHLDGLLLTSGKASRLSVQPLDAHHFERIVHLGKSHAAPSVKANKANATPRSKKAKPGRVEPTKAPASKRASATTTAANRRQGAKSARAEKPVKATARRRLG